MEVIAGTIVLLVVVIIAVGGWAFVQKLAKASKDTVETPDYRNHLAMARWIEHTLDDEMERVVIPAPRQKTARTLLAEFYREDKT